jgi:hypothetical protein
MTFFVWFNLILPFRHRKRPYGYRYYSFFKYPLSFFPKRVNVKTAGAVEKDLPFLFAPKSPKGDLLINRLLQNPL